MAFTITLVFLALLIGYALGKSARPSLNSLDVHLGAIRSALEQLTIALCGDKDMETSIRMTNEVGADLSAEQSAYRGGNLTRIENAIGRLDDRVGRLTEIANKAL